MIELTSDNRLASQIGFLVELDKLKQVLRQTWIMDRSRRENDAEHSWHLAVMAILLKEYAADESVDLAKVLKMVLIHDVVEIDAGDTFAYDTEGEKDKAERETAAAERLFGMLPADQAVELRDLWEEFEARQTGESRFAAALDRLQPILHNYQTQGKAWRQHGISVDQVIARNRHMAEGAPRLWAFTESLIEDAVKQGYLAGEAVEGETRREA